MKNIEELKQGNEKEKKEEENKQISYYRKAMTCVQEFVEYRIVLIF